MSERDVLSSNAYILFYERAAESEHAADNRKTNGNAIGLPATLVEVQGGGQVHSTQEVYSALLTAADSSLPTSSSTS